MSDKYLDEHIKRILGKEIYAELVEWYDDIISGNWDYVVFNVRRCFLLSLIMEKLTGKTMEDQSKAEFLTDGAFFLRYGELAEVYRATNQFPKILICDDTLIHGRCINHLLQGLEEGLHGLLPETDMDDIRDALMKSVDIYIYCKIDMRLLLLNRYAYNVTFKTTMSNARIHKLSSDISDLILYLDMANASYIYSQSLSENDFKKINKKDYIMTSYQNTRQFTKIKYIGEKEGKKAIATLRIVKNTGCEGYRVLPFIFMPNLGKEETDDLLNCIIERIQSVIINEKITGLLRYLYNQPGKRTFNEMVTLILSQALLQEFYRENQITWDSEEDEILKLSRNFNCGYREFSAFNKLNDYKELIRTIIRTEVFSSVDDIANIINRTVNQEREIVCLNLNDFSSDVNDEEKRNIMENLESYFYRSGFEEEKEAHELLLKPYYPTVKRSKRKVRGCGFLLKDLNKGYTKVKTDYSMAYFLQMMDAGVLTLSSYASNNINVVGFSQFVKAGEQSLLIKPLQMLEWIPLISRIQNYCEWRRIDFSREIREYGKSIHCDLKSDFIEKIIQFVDNLSFMGQKAEDWDFNYLRKKEIDIGTENMEERRKRIDFLNLQTAHLNNYDSYRNL